MGAINPSVNKMRETFVKLDANLFGSSCKMKIFFWPKMEGKK